MRKKKKKISLIQIQQFRTSVNCLEGGFETIKKTFCLVWHFDDFSCCL